MSERGTLYFITGPAGARKDAVGRALWRRLQELREGAAALLDDTMLLPMFEIPPDTAENRRLLSVEHELPLCRVLTEQGIDVVLCSVTMSGAARTWAAEHIPQFREIILPDGSPEDAVPTGLEPDGLESVGLKSDGLEPDDLEPDESEFPPPPATAAPPP